jgi:CelD/BcsL family acetyltransferase involved in cellulose biosynthesis/GNAT superfamily N-acetyltransferase
MTSAAVRPAAERFAALRDAQAWDALQDSDTQRAWDLLYGECPWATVFQTRQFATIWYDVYRAVYEPLIVCEWDASAGMAGLWALAVHRDTGQLTTCGAPQAEYYVWLTRPGCDRAFLLRALRALRGSFPGQVLKISFLPPSTPVSLLEEAAPEFRDNLLVPWPRPVRDLRHEEAGESLRKKSNKSRLNRLARTGDVEYRELSSAAELKAHIDQIALFCDFRQGGVHGSFPFRDDPYKREFFLRLAEFPEITHTSVLTAGGELAAFHIGFRSREELTLGLIGHSPLLAWHSPGKLLMLMLTDALARAGVPRFDLTPGGEYKERSQNGHDTAYIAAFAFSRRRGFEIRARAWAAGRVKAVLNRRGIDIHAWIGKLQSVRRLLSPSIAPKLIRFVRRKLSSVEEMRFYALDSAIKQLPERGPCIEFGVNRIEDLMLYRPGESGDRSLQQFLHDSARRLEEGQTVFTYVENGLLLHYAWIAPRGGPAPSGLGNEIQMPDDSCVLWDDYTHPAGRGRGLHKSSIRERTEYARRAGHNHIYINVYSGNTASRKNIEASGFTYAGSMVRSVRWGRTVLEWRPGARTYALAPSVSGRETNRASSPSN